MKEDEFKIEFKNDIKLCDFSLLQPNSRILFQEFIVYCKSNNLRCRITSLISDREGVQSVSTTHQTGRAFDASIKGWTTDEIDNCILHFNLNYTNIAAISANDKKPRAVVHHNSGYGAHLHFQVRPHGV